jgi:predicted PurR-regulated permease PerM
LCDREEGRDVARAAGTSWQQGILVLSGTVVAVTAIGFLYWAQFICIPVAVAVFLSFLLNPVVRRLERWGLGRVPSVVIAVSLTALVLAGVVAIAGAQVTLLVRALPRYSKNIEAKVRTIREMTKGSGPGALERLLDQTEKAWAGEDGQPGAPANEGGETQPPARRAPSPPWLGRALSHLPTFAGRLAEVIGGGALALVLVAFILTRREDLRSRVIRLLGRRQMATATTALDDAGERISRFLVAQACINGSVGALVAIGLAIIGVENALLWGIFAALMRYFPYVGPWITAGLLALLCLAAFPDWWQSVVVFCLFACLELCAGNIAEPLLFGRSIGVSEAALLVSAAFWAFLWGPIGLVLSSPLTVCLAVLGKYVPRLRFLAVILGDEPALDEPTRFYQRLLAQDQDEASKLVIAAAEKSSAEKVFDDLLIGALVNARRDRNEEALPEDHEAALLEAVRELAEEVAEVPGALPAGPAPPDGNGCHKVRVLALPAHDREDQVALELLARLLAPECFDVQVVGVDALTGEMANWAAERGPDVVVVGSLPPSGLAHTRYLCKRLRGRLSGPKILVGRWGLPEGTDRHEEELRQAGADLVSTSLADTRAQLRSWFPILSQGEPTAAVNGRPAALAGK